MCEKRKPDADELAASLVDRVVEECSTAPVALLRVGSSVADIDDWNDYDFLLVEEGGFQQRFYETEVNGVSVELDIWQEQMVRQLFQNYYWNPDKLVAEVGKLRNCERVRQFTQSASLKYALSRVENLSPEIRLFVLSYHVGVLTLQRDAHSRDLLYNPAWNTVSCLAAIEDRYPPSLRRDIITEMFKPNHETLLSQVLDTDPLDFGVLVDEIKDRTPEVLSRSSNDEIELPIYYPQNRLGFDVLDIDYSRWVDDDIVQYRRRF